MKRSQWIAIPALAVAAAASLSAQPSTPEWGVSSSSAETIAAQDMTTTAGADWSYLSNGQRVMVSGQLLSGIHVPQGARITALVIDGCDFSADGFVIAALYRSVGDSTVTLGSVASTLDGTPGCSVFAADLTTPETADYNQYRYWIACENTSTDGLTSVGAVRILYQLQVSPPPGTATFNDVPVSDPAFQFIEALVASGITAGCGNGNFCPDAPLTRRQMAVFLAKALGLHWPESSNPN